MANLDQIIAQIRFQLEQLSAKNAHHDFEHLCRHITRARICTNILPATGPVSAGGDQGRDFETFRTYLGTTSIADSTFIGLASQKPIAFACSLEKEKRISTKIRADVQTIMSSGSAVEGVHYFCAADVTVAKRHNLKTWARQTYAIELEIHDGQSISELLSGRDTFWIAERYLQMPGEIFPRSSNEEGRGWYQEYLTRCREAPPPLTHANFSDIRLAGRNALWTLELKQDLPFWINLLKPYIHSELPGNLSRRAVYETAVLSIRGLGTLDGLESEIRRYFAALPHMEEPADIEDAGALLNFCGFACSQHMCLLTMDELRSWWREAVNRVNDMLATVSTPNKKASLLDERGYLSLSVLSPDPRPRQIEEGFAWWMKMADAIEDAPMFPLEAFADRLTKFIHFFDDVPAYQELTRRIDALLSKRFGSFTAAEKCRDRAVALYDKGKLLSAINELHQSKINWFTAEALEQSMIAMLFIAQCYWQLGLCLAAKYYALGVASIALHSQNNEPKPFIPRALFSAAQYDYAQGSWCGFINMTDISILNHLHFAEDARDVSAHSTLRRVVICAAWVRLLTEKIAPHLLPLVDDALEQWDMRSLAEELMMAARETWAEDSSSSDIWDLSEQSLSGIPFGDAGVHREVAWSELGITWRMRWQNEFDTTRAAEGFVALLQIFLADLAGIDLCLMHTEVKVN